MAEIKLGAGFELKSFATCPKDDKPQAALGDGPYLFSPG